MTAAAITFYESSVGKKAVMAVTGFLTFGWVTIHMLGNLQIFLGPEKLNHYAEFLQSLGGLLWVARAVLLAAILVHIFAATQVTLQSWAARPVKYRAQRFRDTSYAARTMWLSGPLIGLFVCYHLLHLTLGTVHPGFTNNVYNNIVFGFQVPVVAGVYIAAMSVLGLHFSHGLWSMFQSLGLNHPRWNTARKAFAVCFGLLIAFGNSAIPTAVLLGYLQPV